jgi:Spy/CpxP family protein refolding chaperone
MDGMVGCCHNTAVRGWRPTSSVIRRGFCRYPHPALGFNPVSVAYFRKISGAVVGQRKDLNMMRFSSKFLAVFTAIAIVAMAAQMAVAQNEGRRGRGGRGGGAGGPGGMMGPAPMARLATVDTVQDALKLSDEQKEKIKTINDETRDAMRKEFEGGGRPDREKMRKVMDEASEKLNKVLDAGQQKRLVGIFVQVNGAGAVMDPMVAKELIITDEQRDKLREAIGPPRGGRGEGRGEGKGEAKGGGGAGSYRERREKMDKEVMAILTSEQQKKLEEMKGEKVDVDMSKLRGPGGGGRQGRDRGNRGEPKESKSS